MSDIKQSVAKLLKEARLAAGFPTAKGFADKFGVNWSTYTKHEEGSRGIPLKTLQQYLDILNIDFVRFMSSADKTNINSFRAPLIEWSEICRFPKHIETKNRPTVLSQTAISPNSFALSVKDDSMEPVFVEGDIILVDMLSKPQHNDFSIILKGNTVPVFKRLSYIDDQIYAKPLNPIYETIRLSHEDKIIGKVLQSIKNL